MAVDHVKATAITNLDASPRVESTAGEGAPGSYLWNEGFATAVAASSVDATYQLVRIPSNSKVKTIIFESEAQGAGKFDLGLYYATDGEGGQPRALLAAAAINQQFFATVIDVTAAVLPIEVANESLTYSLDKRGQPIWQAVGLTADPGGFFDIVATVKTTAITTGTGKFGIRVGYTV